MFYLEANHISEKDFDFLEICVLGQNLSRLKVILCKREFASNMLLGFP